MGTKMKELIRNAVAIVAIVPMMILWGRTGETHYLFPELGALAVGLIVMNKRTWKIGYTQNLILVLSGAVGTLVEMYLGTCGWALTVPVAFLTTGLLMTACRSIMPPALAAALLPVITETCSWTYVASLTVFVLFTTILQKAAEATGIRETKTPATALSEGKLNGDIILKWLILAVIVMPLVVLAEVTGHRFLMAPPIIVTLVEFSNSRSGFRHRPWQVLLMLMLGSCCGSALMILSPVSGWWLSVAFAITLLVFAIFRKYYAPAAAACLLAGLVPDWELITYPIEIGLGGAYAIVCSSVFYIINCRRSHSAEDKEGGKEE